MPRVLLFDFDGVIVDSIDVCMKRVIDVCKEQGYSKIATKKDFLSLYDNNFYENLVKRGVPKEEVPNLIKEFHIELREQRRIKLFSRMKEVLKELSTHNKIFIVTSNFTKPVKEFLKINCIDCFEEVLGADKETSKVKKMNYVKSKFKGYELFYIGDTKGDIIEGKKAGVKTIAVSWGWHSEEKLKKAKPDIMIHSPNELINLFK